jgi:hypothetical protein
MVTEPLLSYQQFLTAGFRGILYMRGRTGVGGNVKIIAIIEIYDALLSIYLV